jgi:hypothetical protein
MNEKETNKRNPLSDAILSVVTQDIYRLNPFKVLKLPITATLLDAERSAEKLRQMKRLGISGSKGSLATLSEQEIREAIECLRDPKKRIVYEVFSTDLGNDSK